MTCRTPRNTAVICLGANSPDAARQLLRARALLIGAGVVVSATPPYPSEPEYCPADPLYTNQILVVETSLALDALTALCKAHESRYRRPAEGTVAVDIDIVYWNDACLRPRDAASAYFHTGLAMLRTALSK